MSLNNILLFLLKYLYFCYAVFLFRERNLQIQLTARELEQKSVWAKGYCQLDNMRILLDSIFFDSMLILWIKNLRVFSQNSMEWHTFEALKFRTKHLSFLRCFDKRIWVYYYFSNKTFMWTWVIQLIISWLILIHLSLDTR